MTDCIEWQGRRRAGYGHAWSSEQKRMIQATHHVLREELGVDVPSGMCVMHTCDNPGCVNVEHLRVATHADNMADMATKGRTNPQRGAKHVKAKLTEEQVHTIRAKYVPRHPEFGGAALAREYGVGQPLISAIITGRNWAWLKQRH